MSAAPSESVSLVLISRLPVTSSEFPQRRLWPTISTNSRDRPGSGVVLPDVTDHALRQPRPPQFMVLLSGVDAHSVWRGIGSRTPWRCGRRPEIQADCPEACPHTRMDRDDNCQLRRILFGVHRNIQLVVLLLRSPAWGRDRCHSRKLLALPPDRRDGEVHGQPSGEL
jgi:hypothetical protein